MDSSEMAGVDFEQMCKHNSRGEKEGKARQHATGNGFRRAQEQKGDK